MDTFWLKQAGVAARDGNAATIDASGPTMTGPRLTRQDALAKSLRRAPGRPARGDRGVDVTRAGILDAALTLFAERGFDGASMREIAARVGVDHSLLRYHFGDKGRLWREAVIQMVDRLKQEMAMAWGASADRPPAERFKHILRAYVHYCAAHPEHARIMVQESLKPSDRVDWIVDNGVRSQHAALRPLLEQLIADGILPRVSIASIIYIISASAQTIFMLATEVQAAHGIDVTRKGEIDRHADALIALLFKH